MKIKAKAFKETSPYHGAIIISRGITGHTVWYPSDQSISWVSTAAAPDSDLYEVELTDEIHLQGDPIQGAVQQPMTPLQQKALAVGMNLVEAAAVFEDLEIARRKLAKAERDVADEGERLEGLRLEAEELLPDLFRTAGVSEDAIAIATSSLTGRDQQGRSNG